MATLAGGLSLAQLVETVIIWHVNAHCGEVSALQGGQGSEGYRFGSSAIDETPHI
jgi:hypothetical protein